MKYTIYLYAVVITLVFGFLFKDQVEELEVIDTNVYHSVYNAYLVGCLDNLGMKTSNQCYEDAIEYSAPIKNLYK